MEHFYGQPNPHTLLGPTVTREGWPLRPLTITSSLWPLPLLSILTTATAWIILLPGLRKTKAAHTGGLPNTSISDSPQTCNSSGKNVHVTYILHVIEAQRTSSAVVFERFGGECFIMTMQKA